MYKSIFLFLMIGLIISFNSCQKDLAPDEIREVNIYLTDDPLDAEEVNVEILSIVVINQGQSEIELGTIAGIYNLLDFQDDIDTLIASGNVPNVEDIKQVRMILGDNNTIKVDGVIYPLVIPSGGTSGLKLNVDLDLSDLSLINLLIDFDACASVIETGNGTYHLKPVLTLAKKDDDPELSDKIQQYITDNYPDAEVEDVDSEVYCEDTLTQVELKEAGGKLFLYFDTNEDFFMSSVKIEEADLTADIMASLSSNYSDYSVESGHHVTSLSGDDEYWVALESDNAEVEVILDGLGQLICEFNYDEEDNGVDNLSGAILDYINTNYPDDEIKKVDSRVFCTDTLVEVELKVTGSNKEYLLFKDDAFIMSATSIHRNDLPQSVSDTLDNDYPQFNIIGNPEQISDLSTIVTYWVHIKKGNDDVQIHLAKDGFILCTF